MKRIACMLAGIAALASTSRAETNIDAPGTLDIAGETYILTGDISAGGTAFTIAADDVTLDLDGHTVTYNTQPGGDPVYGIRISGNGATVTNGMIVQGAGGSTFSHAIRYSDSRGGGELSYLVIQVRGVKCMGIDGYTAMGGTEIHHVFIDSRVVKDPDRNEGLACIHQDYCNDPCSGDIHDNILVNCHTGIGIEEKENGQARNIYNNLIQHKRRTGIKQPMGVGISHLTRNIQIYDNQIISDNGRGIYISGYGDGTPGPRSNVIRNNRIDVEYHIEAVAGDGNYVENNTFGLYDRYGAGDNTFESNVIMVKNHVADNQYGAFVGSDSSDPGMSGLVYQNNTIVVPDGPAMRYGVVAEVSVRDNDYIAEEFSICNWDCQQAGINVGDEITESGNNQITVESYTPQAPTGLRIIRFLDSYLLRWDDNLNKGESQTFEYVVYRDGEKIPSEPGSVTQHISPRGGTFFVDVDAATSAPHSYCLSALNLAGTEGPQSTCVSTDDASNGWWGEPIDPEPPADAGNDGGDDAGVDGAGDPGADPATDAGIDAGGGDDTVAGGCGCHTDLPDRGGMWVVLILLCVQLARMFTNREI